MSNPWVWHRTITWGMVEQSSRNCICSSFSFVLQGGSFQQYLERVWLTLLWWSVRQGTGVEYVQVTQWHDQSSQKANRYPLYSWTSVLIIGQCSTCQMPDSILAWVTALFTSNGFEPYIVQIGCGFTKDMLFGWKCTRDLSCAASILNLISQ